MSGTKYWLLKTEPESFSIDDLAACPEQTTCWDGVRNYQARNFIRDAMRMGDRVLFYHSNADPPAIVGTARVVREAYPDHTAWKKGDPHFDAKASPDNPIWLMVDIQLNEIFAEPIGIDRLRTMPARRGMELLRRGSRLSVQPVKKSEFEAIIKLARPLADDGKTPRSKKMREGKTPGHRRGSAPATGRKPTGRKHGKARS